MLNRQIYEDYEYPGVLSEICGNYVREKRGSGYKYNATAKILRSLCRFSADYEIPENSLPEDFVRAWIAKKPYETEANRHQRYSTVRGLAEYMNRLGFSAYIPEKGDIAKYNTTFVPYIFTRDEIKRFFTVANQMQKSPYSASPRYHIVMPLLLRTIYCCGLRQSEAARLKFSDVELEQGILTIRDSKMGKSRYVPMSAELTSLYREYAHGIPPAKSNQSNYFFAAPDGGFYDGRPIYAAFRRVLREAGISHGGKGKGPRLHDFRHTFSVHTLQNWVAAGHDVSSMLTKLSAYLGHVNMRYTEPYVRMTAEVYPEVSALLQEKYGELIPRAEDYSYEEND
jgi:integrase